MTHPLLAQVRHATSDADRHRQTEQIIGTVQPLLETALACTDVTRAREVLPLALRTLYIETEPLIGMALVSPAWRETQHRQLFTKAQALFGREQRVVRPLGHEPMPTSPRSARPSFWWTR